MGQNSDKYFNLFYEAGYIYFELILNSNEFYKNVFTGLVKNINLTFTMCRPNKYLK